jgi:hypothetical protein
MRGMKNDDYILDGHHFWIHFVCGFVVGAGCGAWISWSLFSSWWAFGALTAVIALAVAHCCGRWGESAWERILDCFWWLF